MVEIQQHVRAIAIVDITDQLVYMWADDRKDENVLRNYESIAFCAFSIAKATAEERRKSVSSSSLSDMYLGHLMSVDDFQVLGYYSNAHTKVLLICNENVLSDGFFKNLIVSIHGFYLQARLNPFQSSSGPIQSQKFDERVSKAVSNINAGVGVSKR